MLNVLNFQFDFVWPLNGSIARRHLSLREVDGHPCKSEWSTFFLPLWLSLALGQNFDWSFWRSANSKIGTEGLRNRLAKGIDTGQRSTRSLLTSTFQVYITNPIFHDNLRRVRFVPVWGSGVDLVSGPTAISIWDVFLDCRRFTLQTWVYFGLFVQPIKHAIENFGFSNVRSLRNRRVEVVKRNISKLGFWHDQPSLIFHQVFKQPSRKWVLLLPHQLNGSDLCFELDLLRLYAVRIDQYLAHAFRHRSQTIIS